MSWDPRDKQELRPPQVDRCGAFCGLKKGKAGERKACGESAGDRGLRKGDPLEQSRTHFKRDTCVTQPGFAAHSGALRRVFRDDPGVEPECTTMRGRGRGATAAGTGVSVPGNPSSAPHLPLAQAKSLPVAKARFSTPGNRKEGWSYQD